MTRKKDEGNKRTRHALVRGVEGVEEGVQVHIPGQQHVPGGAQGDEGRLEAPQLILGVAGEGELSQGADHLLHDAAVCRVLAANLAECLDLDLGRPFLSFGWDGSTV